jgi:oxaloacetate decarboxylase alpha subunit
VRKDLGYIPLVTPTSQIVGTQAVLNVLMGERYKSITKETQAILKGQYGATPMPVDKELQARVLGDESPITDRPADHLEPEMHSLSEELYAKAGDKGIEISGVEDVLTYALFPQVGLKFLEHRGDPSAFEPPPGQKQPAAPATAPVAAAGGEGAHFDVSVNGQVYSVEVGPAGTITSAAPATAAVASAPAPAPAPTKGAPVGAPLAGNIFKVLVKPGQQVAAREVLVILEAMKMETEVRAPQAGTVTSIAVREGDTVEVGQSLLEIA